MDPKDGPEDQETRKEMEEDRKQVEEEKGAEAAAETGGRHGEDRSQSGSEGVPQPPVKLSEEEAAVNVEQELLVMSQLLVAKGPLKRLREGAKLSFERIGFWSIHSVAATTFPFRNAAVHS